MRISDWSSDVCSSDLLTRYEYGLLAALLARPGAVLSRAQLMDRVWGDALESGDRTVDTHVKTLRAKLHALAPGEGPIHTHRGLGYSLDGAGPCRRARGHGRRKIGLGLLLGYVVIVTLGAWRARPVVLQQLKRG